MDECKTRTNYFRIAPGRVKALQELCPNLGKNVHVAIRILDNKYYACISAHGGIEYYPSGGNGENEAEYLYEMLRTIVDYDDAITIYESDIDSPAEFASCVLIITHDKITTIDPFEEVNKTVRSLLHDPNWETEYYLNE